MAKPNILIVMVDPLSGTFVPDCGPADCLHVPHLKAHAHAAPLAKFRAQAGVH